MTELLPPGIHPGDPSSASHHGEPVPHTRGEPAFTLGRKPWATTNPQALPVFQRLSAEANTETMIVGTATPQKITSRMPGRTKLSLWVPAHYVNAAGSVTANSNGVVVCEDEGELSNGLGGVYLDVGTSMDWFSECGLWVAGVASALPGVLNWAHYWNPLGADRGPDY